MKGGLVMRVLVVEPERRPEVREIDGSLKTMQPAKELSSIKIQEGVNI